jgi:HEPN domain-containing protein
VVDWFFFLLPEFGENAKALWTKKFEKVPPKTHSLTYLQDRLEITTPGEFESFLFDLNSLSVPTRYPEDLKDMTKLFTKKKTMEILSLTKKILIWLKQM